MGYFMRSVLTFSLALLIVLVFGVYETPPLATANSPATTDLPPALECSPGHPLQITLPQTFEKIPSDNPAVLCIFRNKIDGFPTLNIVIEPRIEGSTPPPWPSMRKEFAGATRVSDLPTLNYQGPQLESPTESLFSPQKSSSPTTAALWRLVFWLFSSMIELTPRALSDIPRPTDPSCARSSEPYMWRGSRSI